MVQKKGVGNVTSTSKKVKTTKKVTTKKETKKVTKKADPKLNVKYKFVEEKKPCCGGALCVEAIKQTDLLAAIEGKLTGMQVYLLAQAKSIQVLASMLEQILNKEDNTLTIKLKK